MMKKTERWTLKEVGDSVEVLNQREAIGLKGGSQNGAAEYFLIYGVPLPPNTGYNIATNTCYNLGTDNHVITTAGGGGNTTTYSAPSCPACLAIDNFKTGQPSQDVSTPVTTELGQYLGKTLPHQLGIWGHDNSKKQ